MGEGDVLQQASNIVDRVEELYAFEHIHAALRSSAHITNIAWNQVEAGPPENIWTLLLEPRRLTPKETLERLVSNVATAHCAWRWGALSFIDVLFAMFTCSDGTELTLTFKLPHCRSLLLDISHQGVAGLTTAPFEPDQRGVLISPVRLWRVDGDEIRDTLWRWAEQTGRVPPDEKRGEHG